MDGVGIKRGDIFYVNKYPVVGSEQAAGRPGIVVSNEKNNSFSETVEIVYLTTQPKKRGLPTHVSIDSAPRPSQALCEQVTTVSVERLGNYIGHLTDVEMTRVDMALLVSLDLYMGETGKNSGGHSGHPEEEPPAAPDHADSGGDTSVIIALTTERDTYKAMYESLLEKVLGGVRT